MYLFDAGRWRRRGEKRAGGWWWWRWRDAREHGGGSLGGFHLLHSMYACMLSTYVTNTQVAPGAQCSILS